TTPSKQKLALALSCSTGDINAAIAQVKVLEENETGRESEDSVMAAVDKLEKMVKEDFPDDAPAKPKLHKPKAKKVAIINDAAPEVAESNEVVDGSRSKINGENPDGEIRLRMRDTSKTLQYYFETGLPGECEITVIVSTLMPAKHMLQALETAVELIGRELRDTQQKEV
ncbi:MAG: hypothetical protein IJV46_01825, partial [Acidaminococcaceae bacterium]|nr:hypothetical protein [Acidaminococcaceae bacterium]